VLDELGVEPEEDDPLLAESRRRFEERHERLLPREQRIQLQEALEHFREGTLRSPTPPPARALQPALPDPRRSAQAKTRKHKNKRKLEAASRKANRQKRK
jgi:hypothetical protein